MAITYDNFPLFSFLINNDAIVSEGNREHIVNLINSNKILFASDKDNLTYYKKQIIAQHMLDLINGNEF